MGEKFRERDRFVNSSIRQLEHNQYTHFKSIEIQTKHKNSFSSGMKIQKQTISNEINAPKCNQQHRTFYSHEQLNMLAILICERIQHIILRLGYKKLAIFLVFPKPISC